MKLIDLLENLKYRIVSDIFKEKSSYPDISEAQKSSVEDLTVEKSSVEDSSAEDSSVEKSATEYLDIENLDIHNLVYDSRKVQSGDVFVCISGAKMDAHNFIGDVVNKGAVAVVIEKELTKERFNELEIETEGRIKDVVIIKVESTRYALGCMSAAYFGYPAKKLVTIGVTGTKGKTTTAYMIRSVLENTGIRTGLIGTIEAIIGEEHIKAANTTPESYVVQEYFSRMVEAGCKAVVMEVSSQGLMLHRVAGFEFDYGIFTNLSKDHIGENEHKDFEDYKSCKAKLFKMCKHGIFNIDDKHAEDMMRDATCTIETFAVKNQADLMAKNIKLLQKPGVIGISYDLEGKINMPVEIDIPGAFNVYNTMTAIAVCHYFTKDLKLIENVLKDIRVKGRVEIIKVSPEFTLMIDYAHNAMSLESLLESLKEYNPKRIVTLFGCGGNRSKDRRFEMGEVSARLSDLTIITSDNPRFEKPMDIIADIVTGVEKAGGEYITIPDRKEAIRYAIENGQEGDIIVLAGKGHEDYQEIEGVKYPMDERNLIQEILADNQN